VADYVDLRMAARVNLADLSPISSPLSIYIEPTNICNFKCSFCPESFSDFLEIQGGNHSLTLEDWEKIATNIESLPEQVKTINFYMMGEPLSNPNTPYFIAEAQRRKLAGKIILTSNGSLLNETRAEKLLISPPDFLRISIYGPTDEHHKRITTSRVTLEKIRDNVINFMKLRNSKGMTRPHVYVKMIDQGEELNRQFLDYFEGIPDELLIEAVMNWNDPEQGNLMGSLTKDQLLDTKNFKNVKSVCPSPFYTLVINSDLNVTVCCVDWAKETNVGNLKVQALLEIWMGEKLKDFRLAHLERRKSDLKACKNCTHHFTYPDNLDGLSPSDFVQRYSQAE
jgi:MoaA/NifB/PqqE/SkfB family radical SAM enzyme